MAQTSAIERLRAFSEHIPEQKRDAYGPLVVELAFLEDKMEQSRRKLAKESFSYQPVDASGEPTGMRRRNAEFDGYLSAFAQYVKGLQALAAAIPDPREAAEVRPKGSLKDFRSRYGGLRAAGE